MEVMLLLRYRNSRGESSTYGVAAVVPPSALAILRLYTNLVFSGPWQLLRGLLRFDATRCAVRWVRSWARGLAGRMVERAPCRSHMVLPTRGVACRRPALCATIVILRLWFREARTLSEGRRGYMYGRGAKRRG